MSVFRILSGKTKKAEAEASSIQSVASMIGVKEGVHIVRARIADIAFATYQACPQEKIEGICYRKLKDGKCNSCNAKISKPITAIYLKLTISDLEDQHICKTATVFTLTAELFLGLNADELVRMEEQELDKLEDIIKEKIGITKIFQINVKNNEWIVAKTGYTV